jgi:hypothetical protein
MDTDGTRRPQVNVGERARGFGAHVAAPSYVKSSASGAKAQRVLDRLRPD